MLAGPSGLGKSTYIDKMMSLIDKPVHIYSTDVYIEEIAEQQASSYDKCWSPSAMHVAGKKADAALDEALQQGVDVIWDQTNLSVEKRARIIKLMEQHSYTVHAVGFVPPKFGQEAYNIWMDRLQKRLINEGKSVPDCVLKSMIKHYVPPAMEEGFASVQIVTMNNENGD